MSDRLGQIGGLEQDGDALLKTSLLLSKITKIPFFSIAQIQFWFLAMGVGAAAGFAAILFRAAIMWLQGWLYGTEHTHLLHSHARDLHWLIILLIPTLGGAVVGVIIQRYIPNLRVASVSDVIEGAALNDGRVKSKGGWASTLCSWITLSTGGSSGREGPVVHLAGMISSFVADKLKVDGITGRDLLGCAVAAAVSASFNAPIAGALFALEVVLRHFAIHAFAPIVIAAAAGTVINRLVFGDVTEFSLPGTTVVEFYLELPAFLILGLVCGTVAFVLMRSVFLVDDVQTKLAARYNIPLWMRPCFAGFLLGLIATQFPHIIGVGYETIARSLTGSVGLFEAILFAMIKVLAVSLTLGGRLGGGIFSPSLMVGGLTGMAFGLIATGLFPEVSGASTLYALAGMGAVSAAVLGAPISTTLIVFELTGDWQTGLAVMITVSTSTALASRLVDRSFFLTQLERRNVHLADGPQAYLLTMFGVTGVMRKPGEEGFDEAACLGMVEQGIFLSAQSTLEVAMPLFEKSRASFVPVVEMDDKGRPVLQGALFHLDALKAYNRALEATAAEEHR